MSTIFSGMIFTNLYNYLSASIRALGNSRISFVALIIANVFNAAFSALLVMHFRLGVLGAGLATVFAQLVSVVFLVVYIVFKAKILNFHLVHFSRTDIKAHLRIGLPMGLQARVISLGSIIQQVALNKMGIVVIIAQTIGQKYDGFAGMVTSSLIAMATFAAQNLGAGAHSRIEKGMKQALALAIGYSVIFTSVLLIFNRAFMGLFLNAQSNPEIYHVAMQYYISTGSLYWLLGILFVTRYMLQGLGDIKAPTLAGSMELVFRTIFAIIGVMIQNVWIVFISESVAWIGSTAVLIPATRRMIKKFERLKNNE